MAKSDRDTATKGEGSHVPVELNGSSLVSGRVDTFAQGEVEMRRDGMRYGDPSQVRYATGRVSAPPAFPRRVPDIDVGD